MVPTCTPLRRHAFRSSAASTWSVRSGIRSGRAPKRSTIASRAFGPWNPCSSSCSTSPVVEDPLPRFERVAQPLHGRIVGARITAQRSNHTLVSTKRSTQRVRSAL